jgi:hypothetical protein
MGTLMAHHLAAAEPRDGRAGTQGSPRWRPPPPERRRRFRTLVVLIPVVGAAATLVSAVVRRTGGAIPHAEVYGPLLPASGVWLGVQLVPGPTGSAQQTLAALETRVGRRFDVVHQQLGWDAPLEQVPALEAGQQARIPLLGWQPRRADGSIVPWRSIASGREDARLAAMAIRLRAAPRRVYLAFADQPEAEVGGGYGTAGDYALAYRHIHDLFAKLGVTNVACVWGVMSGSKWASLRARLYPGDAYVDWLAVDVGDARCGRGSAGGSFADITELFHRWATTRHPGKPAMVPGYGGIPEAAAARPEAARLAADLSVVRARRPEIKAVAYSAARRRDGCGRGRLPPSGVTVTTDRHICDKPRARWLARHGYPTTGDLVASP